MIDPNAALSQTLIKTDPDGSKTYYIYGLGLIGEEKDGVYRSYHYDFRGSTVALTDDDGDVTDRYSYGPYGELLNHTGSSQTPFLYNGRDGVMTDDNGLYFMRARYYSPEIKRFITRDEFEGRYDEIININLFTYVNDDPVNRVDPTGNFAWLAVLLPVPGVGEIVAVVVAIGGVTYVGYEVGSYIGEKAKIYFST